MSFNTRIAIALALSVPANVYAQTCSTKSYQTSRFEVELDHILVVNTILSAIKGNCFEDSSKIDSFRYEIDSKFNSNVIDLISLKNEKYQQRFIDLLNKNKLVDARNILDFNAQG